MNFFDPAHIVPMNHGGNGDREEAMKLVFILLVVTDGPRTTCRLCKRVALYVC
jgi:hypothetical protein